VLCSHALPLADTLLASALQVARTLKP